MLNTQKISLKLHNNEMAGDGRIICQDKQSAQMSEMIFRRWYQTMLKHVSSFICATIPSPVRAAGGNNDIEERGKWSVKSVFHKWCAGYADIGGGWYM